MNIFEQAEIHFHQQEQLSVFLESNSSDDIQKAGEIGLLTMFALRMMFNMDVCETTDNLAKFLIGAETAVPAFASGAATGGFQLVPYPGHAGRKQFILKFHLTGGQLKFDLDYKGFGWFATGMGYYGPIAVIGTLRQLAIKRADDPVFLERLAGAAVLCGQAQLGRKISMQNQSQLGFTFLTAVGGEYFIPQPDVPEQFDRLWHVAAQFLAHAGAEAGWPRPAVARLITFTASVHAVLRQFCYDGKQGPPYSQMRDRVASWTLDDALRFAGTMQFFSYCATAKGTTAEKLDAILTLTGAAYRLSDEEVADWRDFTLTSLPDENSFPTKLSGRLAAAINPMFGLQTQAHAPEGSAGLAWLQFTGLIQAEIKRRMNDPKWQAVVDDMMGMEL